MRSQIEKNKEILCDEIERLGGGKMTDAVAAKLGTYRDAYKALCLVDEEDEDDDWHRSEHAPALAGGYYGAGDRAEHHKGGRHRGADHAGGYGTVAPLDRETAVEWARNMENADGTRGAHWTMEQTEEYRAKRGIDSDPLKWWLAMNMIYSDYCKAAEKVNANSLDFYVYMAKAFLDDRDAEPDKLARYYWAIVRK